MKKNGFTVIEIAAAIFLLSACLVAFSQLVAFVASHRVVEEKRQAAVDQLQNVFERLDGIPDEKLAASDFDKSDFDATTRRAVPDGKIEFSCEAAKGKGGADIRSLIFRATVSWDRGPTRPRGEVTAFRLLTPAGKGETEP